MHNNDIFGFDVPMENSFVVEVRHSFQYISDNNRSGLFAEMADVAELVVQLAVAAQLKDNVDVDVVLVAGVELDDVGVLN